jgi:hypothetical protein
MPRPRPIDVRIAETKEKLETLMDQKRIAQLKLKMSARRGKRRRRTM